MNNLKKNRLNKLNKLLMEQDTASMRRASTRRAARGESEQSSKSVKKSSLLNTATDLLTLKGGESVLKKALGKAGVKVGKGQLKKSFLRRAIQSLGPRALLLARLARAPPLRRSPPQLLLALLLVQHLVMVLIKYLLLLILRERSKKG